MRMSAHSSPRIGCEAVIAVSSILRRCRRRVALAAVVVALAGSVALAHGAAGERHMAVGTAVAACLAVAAEAGIGLAAAARRAGTPVRGPRLVERAVAVTRPAAPAWAVPSRASPAELQVFRR